MKPVGTTGEVRYDTIPSSHYFRLIIFMYFRYLITFSRLHFLIELTMLVFQIWVQCPHNASGYFSIYGEESEYGEHFNARLVTGSTGEVYARTGYLGFLRRTEVVSSQAVPGIASEATDLSDLSALAINAPPTDSSGNTLRRIGYPINNV